MSKLFRKLAIVGLAAMMAVAFVGPLPVAYGQTSAELQATINSLLQQIQALQAQLSAQQGGSSASYNFAKDLTLGSKGADVTALQDFLVAQNKGSVAQKLATMFAGGVAKGYFGPATKAAVAEYQAAVGISPAAGYFGPKTRSYVNSLAVTPGQPGGQPSVPAVTGLSVSLASDNPAAGNFPAGGNQIPFLKLAFTAGSQDVTVTAMNAYRGGLSSDNDISNVYLMDGDMVLASNLGLANGKANFSAPTGLFTVKAGTSKVVTIAADISSSNTSSHTYTWSVNAASDVTASAAVSGSFPFAGNSFTAVSVSNPSLATLTVTPITTGGTVNAGTTGFLAGQFSMQSANSAVSVKSIKLTETGTITAASDLGNIKLMNGTVQVGSTASALNADGTIVFDLSSNPLQIASGQTVNLSVYADVLSGVSRNFRFTFQRSYDVVAKDMTYNVGATISGTFPAQGSQVSISSGTLVVSKNVNSPVNYVIPGGTNQTLASFDFKASGEAVRITALTYQLAWTGGGAENAAWNNLKLVDDQGVQIGSLTTSGTSTTSPKVVSLTNLNYIIPTNTTRVLSVKSDIVSSYTGSVTASLNSGTGQGYTSLSSITVGSYAGNSLSASNTPFSGALNNGLGAVTTVSGALEVKVGSFVLQAGPAEGVNVISVTLTTGSAVASQYNNLVAKYGSTQIGTTQTSLANSTAYTFTASSPIAIAANGSVVVDVYANTVSGVTSSAASVVSLTASSATGASSQSLRSLPSSVTGQTVAVNSSGTLTTAAAAPQVVSQQVGMGVTGVKFASFKLSADNNEAIDVTNVTVNATTTAAQDLVNIKLMNGSTQVGSTIYSLSGTTSSLSFAVSNLQVPQNQYVTLDVIADVNTSANGAASADTATVGLGAVSYQGNLSKAAASTSNVIVSGVTMTIYKTTLSAASGPSFTAPAGLSDGSVVGQFTFTVGSGNDAVVKTVSLSQAGSLIQTSSSVVLKIYGSDAPTTVLATTTATSTNTYAFTLNGSTGWTVPKSSDTYYLFVKADLASALNLLTTTGTKSYQIKLQSLTWNDGTTNGIGLNPTIVTPINGQVINFTF